MKTAARAASLIPLVLASLLARTASAQFDLLHEFRGDQDSIRGGLTLAPDGSLYGTTYDGGAHNLGSVFVLRPDGSGDYTFDNLHDFNGADGANPAAALLLASDGSFYGTTEQGGIGWGTLFQVDGISGAVTTIHMFAYGDGAHPSAPLVEGSDGFLYGTTNLGGSQPQLGTIFRWDISSDALTILHTFQGGADGAVPMAALLESADGKFYGTTDGGGDHSNGTVFALDPILENVTILHSFDEATEGRSSRGALVEGPDGFYGTLSAGGPNTWGSIFRVDGTGMYTTVHTFTGADGGEPAAGLILGADGNFYGTTRGGESHAGTVFRVSPDGHLGTIHAFNGLDGARPQASLVEDADGNLYGTTSSSGHDAAFGNGTVFRIDAAGSLTTLHRLTTGAPAEPRASLIEAPGGDFYGTSSLGGEAGYGTLFRMSSTGTINVAHSFQGSDGSFPVASLVLATDGNLYGVASEGGFSGWGTIFRVDPSGAVTVLHQFDFFHGASPRARLIQGSDGHLYGTTSGGGEFFDGTVFRLSLTGVFTLLHSFDGDDGRSPLGLTEGRDGTFYGAAVSGGADDRGTIFRMEPSGDVTVLHSFSGADGSYPFTSLIQAVDGEWYGTTLQGGDDDRGTFFKMSSSGGLATLHHFTGGAGGGGPRAGLIQGSDGKLYGTTVSDGSGGRGTIFQIDTSGAQTVLHPFDFWSGADPLGELVQASDGHLYGTAWLGGERNKGVAFRLALGLLAPEAVASGSATICVGASTLLTGSGGVSCSWSPVRGLDDPSSCTPEASPDATTFYTLTVTDASGQISLNKPTIAVTVDCPESIPVTPVPGGLVSGTLVPVHARSGDQDDPHLDGDLISYTNKGSAPGWSIRYYRFSNGVDVGIPTAGSFVDLLSDVSGERIVFSRVLQDRTAALLFDAGNSQLTEIDPHAGTARFGTSVAGDTLAFVEANQGNGDIFAWDLSSSIGLNVSASTETDENPSVSPDGTVLVWVRQSPPTGADVLMSRSVGGIWGPATPVANTTDPEENPDTDGTWVVYDSTRADGRHIYLRAVAGGPELRLALSGSQSNPSINQGVVSFESASTSPGAKSDMFVYVIATNTLYQVADTPAIGEHLNDVRVLSNGDVRVVWAADESPTNEFEHDIHALTFTLVDPARSTSTALSSSPNPSTSGQNVTFTASVTANVGTPTGAVTFNDGPNTVGTVNLNNSGQATFTTSSLTVGSHSITAVYSGDATHDGSTSNVLTQTIQLANVDLIIEENITVTDTVTVTPSVMLTIAESITVTDTPEVTIVATTVTLTSTPNPSVGGDPVVLTATATSPLGVPAGDVEFSYRIPGTPLPRVLGTIALNASGSAILTTSELFVGNLTVTASYPGDAVFSPGSTSISHTVTPAPTTTGVASSGLLSITTRPPIFTVTVGTSAPWPATGTVEFFADGAPIGRSRVFTRGGVQIAVMGGATLGEGTHSITAQYSGDAAHLASATSPLSQTVAQGDYLTVDLTPTSTDPSTATAVNNQDRVVGYIFSSRPVTGPQSTGFLYSGGGFVDLGNLGGTTTFPIAINEVGQVVGVSSTSGHLVPHAFLYQGGQIIDLGTLGGATSRALAINNSGQVVGFADTSSEEHAFLYDSGTMADLGTLGGANSAALAINSSGFAAGFADLADGTRHAGYYTYPWLDLGTLGGTTSRAVAINDAGQVAGTSDLAGDFDAHPFLWQGGPLIDIAGVDGPSSTAVALNDAGQVVGWTFLPEGGTHPEPPSPRNAFLYSSGQFTELGTLAGGMSQAADVSNSGLLVGISDNRAFVSSGGALRDLGTLGGARSSAVAINDRGLIVGEADTASGVAHAVAWLPVPLPTLTVAPAVGLVGGTTTLSATLTLFGQPAPNQTIAFALNGTQVGSASTNASGIATLPGISLAGFTPGAYPGAVRADFAGSVVVGATKAFADLTVTPPPVAVDDAYATNEDTSLSIAAPGVLRNDTDVGIGEAILVAGPRYGTLTFGVDGGFDYRPTANFFGSDSFTYSVGIGGVTSNIASVTLTVSPVDDAPVAADDDYAAGLIAPLSEPAPGVLGNDTDVEGDALTAELVSGPTRGALTLNLDGSFVYTPSGAPGDSFTYRAVGAGVPSNVATVRIGIAPDFQGVVAAPRVTINNSFGDQTEPRVDSDLVTYTENDSARSRIRYYSFSTGSDLFVPAGVPGENDVLSDVNARRIVFSRTALDGTTSAYLFDTLTLASTEIDPQPGSTRFGTVIGGDVVAFTDYATSNGDVYAWDLRTSTLDVLDASPLLDLTPGISPDGAVIAWPRCDSSGTHCTVMKAVRSAGQWMVSPVPGGGGRSFSVDTDGTWIAHAVDRTGVWASPHLYLTRVQGGPEVRLAVPGVQFWASINRGVVSFSSAATSSAPADVYAYVIATNRLYQVTDTPSVHESLNDVSVLANGDIRVVWLADDDLVLGNHNVYAVTFTPSGPVPPLVATDDAYTTNEDSPLVEAAPGVLSNDSNATGGTVGLVADDVSHGTLVLRADGSFDYTPAANFFGSDSFTYSLSFGGVTSNIATVFLTIAPVDDAPVAADDAFQISGTTLTITDPGVLGNDSDADGDALTAVLVTGPAQGTLTLNNDGSFTYAPNGAFPVDSFQYTTMAMGRASNVATVTIARDELVPVDGGMVTAPRVTINDDPGQHLDPHVDGDLASYTDENGGSPEVRYYNFATQVDDAIPLLVEGDTYTLSDVNNGRVSATRQDATGERSAIVFDSATSQLVEIDPPGSVVFGTAIGGDTLAFLDLAIGNGDILLWNLATAAEELRTASPLIETSMAVSPDGNTAVWQRCSSNFTHCDIVAAMRSGGSWLPSDVATTSAYEQNPDTDGTWIVYDSDRVDSTLGPDIYLEAVAGGAEVRLALPGTQRNPSVSRGVVSFESLTAGGSAADLFVYVIATNTLYRVTDTPAVNETLNDVTVLLNGDIRSIWAANDGVLGDNNIYALTFMPSSADILPPVVSLTKPVGGERVFSGTPYVVQWTATDDVGVMSVDVEFSSNGGATYGPIAGCTGLSGAASSCTWAAPGPVTTQGRIRVTARDAAGNSASAMSPANFTVVAGSASLNLTRPVTSLTFRAGDTQAIRFTHNLGVGQKVVMELSRNGGATFETVHPAFVTTSATVGVFNWLVTAPATTQARVRVSWSGNPSVSSTSPMNFTILDRVNVIQPNTAVSWPTGSTRNINWRHNLGTAERVNIDLSRDGGATWSPIAANVPNATATTGSFAWIVTGPATTRARVRVSWTTDPNIQSVSAVDFTISGTITLTAPTGASIWAIGTARTVTWNHTLGAGQTFDIDLSMDNGATFPIPVARAVAAGSTSGAFDWTVPGPLSTTARLRVRWTGSSAVSRTSGPFTMADPFVRVTAPNTNVLWTVGTSRNLTFAHNLGIGQVVLLELSRDGGVTFAPITSFTTTSATSGTFAWTVTGPPTTQARVRATWSTNSAVTDHSDVNFRIQ